VEKIKKKSEKFCNFNEVAKFILSEKLEKCLFNANRRK